MEERRRSLRTSLHTRASNGEDQHSHVGFPVASGVLGKQRHGLVWRLDLVRDGCTCEKPILLAGASARAAAAAHLVQSAVDQAAHQGTAGHFESVSTWMKKKKKSFLKTLTVQNKEESRRTAVMRNSGGTTCNHTVQVDVGEGLHAQRRQVSLNTNDVNYSRLKAAPTAASLTTLTLTSNHSVAPTLPYSPALQLANTMLLLGLKPPVVGKRRG